MSGLTISRADNGAANCGFGAAGLGQWYGNCSLLRFPYIEKKEVMAERLLGITHTPEATSVTKSWSHFL
jgi:hypothetical protein